MYCNYCADTGCHYCRERVAAKATSELNNLVSVHAQLLKEAAYLLHVYGPDACPNWIEGAGDCGACEACRVFKCIDELTAD